MREVLIVARCDRCSVELTDVPDEPLPKWVVAGVTYRPELCAECDEYVLEHLKFLRGTEIRKSSISKSSGRTTGKFTHKPTPCPVCGQVFKSEAGVTQHIGQVARQENRNGQHRKHRREAAK
jgi:hypothetical protein